MAPALLYFDLIFPFFYQLRAVNLVICQGECERDMLTRYISMKDKLERHTTAKDKPATYACEGCMDEGHISAGSFL